MKTDSCRIANKLAAYALSGGEGEEETSRPPESRGTPTGTDFCRLPDQRSTRKYRVPSYAQRHLTEKSALPYKPYTLRGGSRASLRRTLRIRGLPTWISPVLNG